MTKNELIQLTWNRWSDIVGCMEDCGMPKLAHLTVGTSWFRLVLAIKRWERHVVDLHMMERDENEWAIPHD